MKALESWHISDDDIGIVTGFSGSKLKVYIGKVFPLLSCGKPKSKLVTLDKTCMINDKKCKPKVSAKVRSVNYITIPTDSSINAKLVKYGTKVRLKSRNDNVDTLCATRFR